MAAISGFAGSSCAIKLVAVSPVPTTDVITFSGSVAAITNGYEWSIEQSKTGTELATQGSDAADEGGVWVQQLRGGIHSWTARIQIAATAASLYKSGQALRVDFLLQANANIGRQACDCVVQGISEGSATAQPFATMTLNLKGSGALPPIVDAA